MTIRLGINGYGRIGRLVLRAMYENNLQQTFTIAGINDPADTKTSAHLTRYDTAHGRFNADVEVVGNDFKVNGDLIPRSSTRDAREIPWRDWGVDIVLDCTGKYKTKALATQHLDGGASYVLISAPGGDDVDATVVYGVNHQILTKDMKVVSNASCTTNCMAPVLHVMQQQFGIERGTMCTVHAYTNDQKIVDAHHKDLRRARAAGSSIIPTKTGAATAIGLVIPELEGKLTGYALRVPVNNVSAVDLTLILSKEVSVDTIHQALSSAAESELKNVLRVTDEPLVSCDFNHDPASAVVDMGQTRVNGNMVQLLIWYDNEWGFANRMLDVIQAWLTE